MYILILYEIKLLLLTVKKLLCCDTHWWIVCKGRLAIGTSGKCQKGWCSDGLTGQNNMQYCGLCVHNYLPDSMESLPEAAV
jgi:hypothetical protein